MIKGSDNLRFRFRGPVPAPHICGVALKCLGLLKQNLSFQGLKQGASNHVLPDGTYISCRTCWGADSILVTTPFQPPVPNELLPVKKYKCTEFFGFYFFYATPQERLEIEYDKDSPALFQTGESFQAGEYSGTIQVIRGNYIAGDFPVQITPGMSVTGILSGAKAIVTDAVKRHCRMLYTVNEVISNIAADILPENSPGSVAASIISPVEFPPISDSPVSDITNVPNPVIQTKVLDHLSVTACQYGNVNNQLAQKWYISATVNGENALIDGEQIAGGFPFIIPRNATFEQARYNFDVWSSGENYFISCSGEQTGTTIFVYRLYENNFILETEKISTYIYPVPDPYNNTRCVLSKDKLIWFWPSLSRFYAEELITGEKNTFASNFDGSLIWLDVNPVTRDMKQVVSLDPVISNMDAYRFFTPLSASMYFSVSCVPVYDPRTLTFIGGTTWGCLNPPQVMTGQWKSQLYGWQEMVFFQPLYPGMWSLTLDVYGQATEINHNNIIISDTPIHRGYSISGKDHAQKIMSWTANSTDSSNFIEMENCCAFINRSEIGFTKWIPLLSGTFAATYVKYDYGNTPEGHVCGEELLKGVSTEYTIDASIAQETGWKLVCLGSKDRNGNNVNPFIVYNSNRVEGLTANTPVGQRVFATFLNVKKCREI